MLRAITHKVPASITECELTFIDRSPIDLQVARRQHDDYCAVLEKLGVMVERLSENESYPDSCFVEDTAIVVDELAVICSMGVSSRQGETALIERELSKYRDIARIALPAMIEGGDVLRVGKRVFVGQSSRTNEGGVKELARILGAHGYEIKAIGMKSGLHLKSACTALDDETLFVNPEWIELDELKDFNLVRTPAEEPWSANVIRVGDTVCVQAGFPKAAELMESIFKNVEIVDTSELRKAEAALTCSSIIFESEA